MLRVNLCIFGKLRFVVEQQRYIHAVLRAFSHCWCLLRQSTMLKFLNQQFATWWCQSAVAMVQDHYEAIHCGIPRFQLIHRTPNPNHQFNSTNMKVCGRIFQIGNSKRGWKYANTQEFRRYNHQVIQFSSNRKPWWHGNWKNICGSEKCKKTKSKDL